MGLSEQETNDIYATSGVFFNMISNTLMQLPHVHMFLFNESAAHFGGMLCTNPLGAHTCEVPYVINQLSAANISQNDPVQQNMRKVWANFATSGNPGWSHDEVGVFTDGQIVVRGAAFDPVISSLLTKLMCHPATIKPACEISHTYTCGEIKAEFRRNLCCGNPSKTFEFRTHH